MEIKYFSEISRTGTLQCQWGDSTIYFTALQILQLLGTSRFLQKSLMFWYIEREITTAFVETVIWKIVTAKLRNGNKNNAISKILWKMGHIKLEICLIKLHQYLIKMNAWCRHLICTYVLVKCLFKTMSTYIRSLCNSGWDGILYQTLARIGIHQSLSIYSYTHLSPFIKKKKKAFKTR